MSGLSRLIEIMTSIQKHIDVAVYTQKYYEAKNFPRPWAGKNTILDRRLTLLFPHVFLG